MANCDCNIEIKDRQQRKTLIILLLINGAMFVVELVTGLIADSTGLIADAFDMLADAMVYAIGLYAVGKTIADKARAALWSGIFQLLLGLGVMADVLRRLFLGSAPDSLMMMGIGVLALAANVTCLSLINSHKQGEVHMRASWLFSRNDVIANLGVMTGGLLVMLLHSPYPDLIIGTAIALLVTYGGKQIIHDALTEQGHVR